MNAFTLNRRAVMLSAVIGATSTFLGGAAGVVQAQTKTPGSGNIGHYRFRVGEITATVLSDGVIGGPPRIYASDAPEAELQEVLRRAFLPTDHLTLNLIRCSSKMRAAASSSKQEQAARWDRTQVAFLPIWQQSV